MKSNIAALSIVTVLLAAPVMPAMSAEPAAIPADATGLCSDGTYWKAASKQGACSGHKGVKLWYGTRPKDATGRCNDGTYWTGANKQGACSGHKGVQDWYAGTK